MEGYQKSGTARFAILVPFTTYGNGHNCVPYRTVPNRTAQWKRAIKEGGKKSFTLVSDKEIVNYF